MQNAGLDESQAGIKIARRNINNLRYADVTVLMAESKEELKSLLMKVKEESASSVQFSCSVMSDSATPWTAALQASLSIINSWSLLTLMSIESVMPSNTSSSVVPFSSHLQSFPGSGSFQMSQFFASGGQSIGISVSASVLPMTISLGLTDLISLQSKGL